MTLHTSPIDSPIDTHLLRSHLNTFAKQLWESIDVCAVHEYKKTQYTLTEQLANERYIKKSITSLVALIEHLKVNTTQPLTDTQKEFLMMHLKGIILRAPFLNPAEKQLMTRHDFIEGSLTFLETSLTADPELTLESLGQAFRNFWIANLLQVLFNKSITCHPALYAYSMLYPYTDNLMDDSALSSKDKLDFCTRLSQTLSGKVHHLNFEHVSESRIHELCHMIFSSYKPHELSSIQFGLQWIHEAQMDSMAQFDKGLMPYEKDLRYISFNKGGASLIADALLVSPNLSKPALEFVFVFGAILQLCDDLQDTYNDACEGHQTLFSQLKDHYTFDRLLDRLLLLTEQLPELASQANLSHDAIVSRVVVPNTVRLLIFASIEHQHYFSRRWITHQENYLPISFNGLKRIKKQFKKTSKQLPFMKIQSRQTLREFKKFTTVASL